MFYKYKITYFDECKGNNFPSAGIVWGNNYGDAANKIVEDYCKDNVIDLYLYEIAIDGNYCIDMDELEQVMKKV